MATGPISTFGAITAGAGYTDNNYLQVPLTGGSGSGAFANVTVAAGVVTAVTLPNLSTSAQVDRTGKNYQVGDVLSMVDPANGGGAGFSVPVLTLAQACENCFFGLIVPASAQPAVAGQRYCSRSSYLNQQSTNHGWESMLCQDNYFCGAGANKVTGLSFSSIVNSLPQPPGSIDTLPWTDYTPTVLATTGAFGNVVGLGRYKQIAKTLLIRVEIQVANVGTAADALTYTIPVAVASTVTTLPDVISGGVYSGTDAWDTWVSFAGAADTKFTANGSGGSFTLSNNDILVFEGMYEID